MTYYEYLETSSGKIPEIQFGLYTARAENLLTKITDGRLYDCGGAENYAIAELAERLFAQDSRGDIARETNDGYSVEYTAPPSPQAMAKQVARTWLPEAVLYAGVGKDDC